MHPRDPRIDPVEPSLSARGPSPLAGSALLPLSAAIVLLLLLVILSAHHNGPRGRHHQRRSIGAVGDAVTLAVDFTAGADADPDNGVSAHSGTYPVAAFVAELRP